MTATTQSGRVYKLIPNSENPTYLGGNAYYTLDKWIAIADLTEDDIIWIDDPFTLPTLD